MKAFSVDFVGELALFKKNDANDMIHISYNFIHKPMLLGIFGAILGIPGYAKSVDVSKNIKTANEMLCKLMAEIKKEEKLTKKIKIKILNLLEILNQLRENVGLETYQKKIDL